MSNHFKCDGDGAKIILAAFGFQTSDKIILFSWRKHKCDINVRRRSNVPRARLYLFIFHIIHMQSWKVVISFLSSISLVVNTCCFGHCCENLGGFNKIHVVILPSYIKRTNNVNVQLILSPANISKWRVIIK